MPHLLDWALAPCYGMLGTMLTSGNLLLDDGLAVKVIHSTLPIVKNAEIFLHYRWLFIKGDIIIGDWEIFGAGFSFIIASFSLKVTLL